MADQPLCFFQLTRLVAQNAERVQRLEMAWIAAQQFAVKLRRFREFPGTAQAKRVLQHGIVHGARLFETVTMLGPQHRPQQNWV